LKIWLLIGAKNTVLSEMHKKNFFGTYITIGINIEKNEIVDGNEDSKGKDFPMELFMCILRLVDDRCNY